jgi:transposase
MSEGITTFVGLDVHKESIAIAVAVLGREAPRFIGTTGPSLKELLKALSHLGTAQQMHIVYEAGPGGYVLVRQLRAQGYRCEVVAPSKIPRRSGERIKTDRRDALSLAHFARAGDLSIVTVPDSADEAIRDLSRAREDALRARMTARHQLKALLLRHGKHYPMKTSWTLAHERHLSQVNFEHPAQSIAFTEYRSAVREANDRLERITEALRQLVSEWRLRTVVEALMSLRGIDFICALTLVAELGDLRRFAHPKQLMSFLGLVPSESSSGQTRTQGHITRTGNTHARRVLIEAAWSYRYPARIGREIQIRQQHLPRSLREISWRAQLRLCQRYRRFAARGVHQNRACVAIARELTGFIWDLAQHVPQNN